jgi:hypothetical protein
VRLHSGEIRAQGVARYASSRGHWLSSC